MNFQEINKIPESQQQKYIYRSCIAEAKNLDDTLRRLQSESCIDDEIYPAWEVISVTPISVEHYEYPKGYFNTTDFMIIYRLKEQNENYRI